MNYNQLDDFFGLTPDNKERPQQKPWRIKEFVSKKFPSGERLRLIPKVLSRQERYIVLGLVLILLGSIVAIPFATFHHFTKAVPANGGTITEGILGEPHLINPLLNQSNDADRDLTALIYSGLLKYNSEGKLVPDLAKSYEISPDGLNYTVYLKTNAVWHDSKPVTADDVVFTIQTAQNADVRSSKYVNWHGVSIEKISETGVIFKLEHKYAQFLGDLTMGILPKHLWQDIKPSAIALVDLNIKPIGSGPFRFKQLTKDKYGQITAYELTAHENFYDGRPFLDKIILKFYPSEKDLVDAYNGNDIDSIGFISIQALREIKFKSRLSLHQLKLPRYFALFLNQTQSLELSNKTIRNALNYAVDKPVIIQEVLDGYGVAVDSPVLPGVLDIASDFKSSEHNPGLAKNILASASWQLGDDGIFVKKAKKKGEKDIRLTIKLTTSTWPEFVQVATMVKDQLRQAGIEINLETLPIAQLQQVIKERDYQILLFGAILGIDPDPFSLWHSSQKRDPGLNLALYDNQAADILLEEARQTLNPLDRVKKYEAFQNLIIQDAPAVFLYSPLYIYGQNYALKGFATKIISMPADRFVGAAEWYIQTRRILR